MLSRVAERIYWFGRYLERVEDTARLLAVNTQLALDFPGPAQRAWHILLDILGGQAAYSALYPAITERNVMRYLVADDRSPASLVAALRIARENARTVREIFPSEAWESINNLYLLATERAESALVRKERQDFFEQIVGACQQLAGLLVNTMSHRAPYHFLSIGWMLERADMTSRVLDVGSFYAQENITPNVDAHESILWMNLLLSLSAYQMYRQETHERVNGRDVIAFLLHDVAFPRSIRYCVDRLENALAALPRHQDPLRGNRMFAKKLASGKPETLIAAGLHEFVDGLQAELGLLDHDIAKTWFGWSK